MGSYPRDPSFSSWLAWPCVRGISNVLKETRNEPGLPGPRLGIDLPSLLPHFYWPEVLAQPQGGEIDSILIEGAEKSHDQGCGCRNC